MARDHSPNRGFRKVCSFRAHDALIRGLDFHPKKKILASVSKDMSIKLWDYAVDPPRLIRTVLGPTDEPMYVAFNATGTLLGTSGVEHAVGIWEVEKLLNPER